MIHAPRSHEALAGALLTRIDYVYEKSVPGSTMRILVERDLFLESCRLAERVLPARTTDVSRAHLLVQAGGDTCTLHATGAGIALRLGVPAEVEQPGQALLPARQAVAILREAEADVLLLESMPGR